MLKKSYRICLTLVFLLSFAASAFAADKTALSKLIILHTNDTHGYHLRDASRGVNGLAAIAGLKKQYENMGFNVILLDAGDAIQDNNLVNLSKGATAIQFFNAVGYDAATFGNHEFDYGQDVLLQRISEANYKYLCSNVIVEATGQLFAPAASAIIDKGGVKVGVFGLVTPTTKTGSHPKNVRGLKFLEKEDMYACAENEARKLKAQGADVVIALTHLGSEEASAGNNSEDIIRNAPSVDLIIDGHDHRVKINRIDDEVQAETGCYTQNAGVVRYFNDQWQSTVIPYGALNPRDDDKQVAKLVQVAQKAVDKQLASKIGVSKVTLDGTRFPGVRTQEMNSGDFFADAYLWQARQLYKENTVDGAIINGGSIRASVNAGKVLEADIRRSIPYDNELAIVPITGAKLYEILESASCATPDAMGAFPQVAGISYTIDTTKKFVPGNRYPRSDYHAPEEIGNRIKDVKVNGQPVELDKIYRIVVASFIACGGDAYGGLTAPDDATFITPLECPGVFYFGCTEVDGTINFIKSELGGVIGEEYAQPQGRITIIK